MNILIACEESQRVCSEFRKKGHNAFSCDIQMTTGDNPEWHIWQDVTKYLNGKCEFLTCDGKKHYIEKWDMIIAFPPCTYLTKASGNSLIKNGNINQERFEKGIKAKNFFEKIFNAKCKKIVIENPTPLKIFNLPKHNQTIQPYYFGEEYSKQTNLWIKGLPLLTPTNIIKPKYNFNNYPPFKNCNGKYRAKARSKTPIGIAKAMAEQWG